jgi:hypothetical protein
VIGRFCKSVWLWQVTKEELARRKPFQDAIKRPYFHVKPLDASQLSAWSRFLDYVEGRGDDEVTVHLYERCLVACAEYPGALLNPCSLKDLAGWHLPGCGLY